MSTTTTTTKPIALIIGATGAQGGAVVKQLLASPKNPFTIRILTRNPSSPKATALAEKGVEVLKGDLAEPETLTKALEGVSSAFLVTDFQGPEGTEGETKRGNAFVDAAKAAGVQHLVFTSVDGAERASGVPHFDSKFAIEEHIRASGIPNTILRPVAFMDNFPVQGGVKRFMTLGLFDTALRGKKLQLVATEDIGWFAARALEEPEEYKGKAVGLAGDEVTMTEVKEAYEKVEGAMPWEAPVPAPALSMLPEETGKMFNWFYEHGYTVDIPALRKVHPDLMTMVQWLRSKQPDLS